MMFDFSAYYDKIVELMPDNCRVCEVGIANSDSALYLAEKLFNSGKKFHLYMVDDFSYGQYEQMITVYENIIKSGLGHHITVIAKDSVEASKHFNGHSLHFVFLDSSHLYEPTLKEVDAWYPKLLDEYYLAGHDYLTHEGVRKAINEKIPTEKLEVYETDNGYGVWAIQKQWFINLNK